LAGDRDRAGTVIREDIRINEMQAAILVEALDGIERALVEP